MVLFYEFSARKIKRKSELWNLPLFMKNYLLETWASKKGSLIFFFFNLALALDTCTEKMILESKDPIFMSHFKVIVQCCLMGILLLKRPITGFSFELLTYRWNWKFQAHLKFDKLQKISQKLILLVKRISIQTYSPEKEKVIFILNWILKCFQK